MEPEKWIWTVGVTDEDGINAVTLEIGAEGNPLVVDLSSEFARRIGKALLEAADEIDPKNSTTFTRREPTKAVKEGKRPTRKPKKGFWDRMFNAEKDPYISKEDL